MAKVHRAYRHSWWRRSKQITQRDWQAMCNFADNGVPFEALAEHFSCKLTLVEEEIICTNAYGHKARRLFSSTNGSDLGSDRTDALRTFQQVLRRLDKREIERTVVIEAQDYLERRFGPEYVSAGNIEMVERTLDKIAVYLEEVSPGGLRDFATVKAMLDQMIS